AADGDTDLPTVLVPSPRDRGLVDRTDPVDDVFPDGVVPVRAHAPRFSSRLAGSPAGRRHPAQFLTRPPAGDGEPAVRHCAGPTTPMRHGDGEAWTMAACPRAFSSSAAPDRLVPRRA